METWGKTSIGRERVMNDLGELLSARKRERVEALGWAWAEACNQLDRGEDPREYDQAGLLPRAYKDLGWDDAD